MDSRASVSELWERVSGTRLKRDDASPLPFDWFILALTLLYAMKAIDLEGDFIIKRSLA